MTTLLAREGLSVAPGGFALTSQGLAWLADMGFVPEAASSKRRFAYPCLDWSHGREHLAGQLADELLRHFIQQGWLRHSDGRALDLTPRGQQLLVPMSGSNEGQRGG
jgi:hypothetical protein